MRGDVKTMCDRRPVSPSPEKEKMMELNAIHDRVCAAMPSAQVHVTDMRGGDHIHVVVVSEQFAGMSRIQRHQMVHALFQSDLQNGAIHALQMTCKTPGEIDANH